VIGDRTLGFFSKVRDNGGSDLPPELCEAILLVLAASPDSRR
jgi:hypothetical protein